MSRTAYGIGTSERAVFDYDGADWTFVSRILDENSRRLSRTRSGVIDVGTHPSKKAVDQSPDEIRLSSAKNERAVHRIVFDTRNDPSPADASAVRDLLFLIADRANDGLLPAGRLRTWPIVANQRSWTTGAVMFGPADKVAPERLHAAIDGFCDEVHRRWPELESDPVPLAAWAEWELNGGSLHPFYDGCGRISRCFGALLLVRGSWLLPLYDTRESYFESGNRGIRSFADYMHERIGVCQAWLRSDGNV